MKVYVNEAGEIHDVGETTNPSLTELVILDDENPFKDWSVAKICCYRVSVLNGHVTMMAPYVDDRIIPIVDRYGSETVENTSDISDNREGLIETFEVAESNAGDLADVRAAIEEVYEMISKE